MEMKRRKQRTIAAVFFKYVCVLAGGVLFWLVLLVFLFIALSMSGEILPANYAEVQLNETAAKFREAPEITEDMIPLNCTYGVYRSDGRWMYGTFPAKERNIAWEYYQAKNIYTHGNGYYSFIERGAGEVCIVNYEITVLFKNAFLRKYLPRADVVLVVIYVILLLLHTVVVSRSFGKYMKEKLSVLNKAAGEIRNRNLEFEREHSEIKEVEEVLDSLYQMKETLSESLYRQWDLEKSKEKQIVALAHDLKTPLTVIRGNAELLAEGELSGEEQEYDQDILQSVEMLEEYLAMLNEIVLAGEDAKKSEETLQKSRKEDPPEEAVQRRYVSGIGSAGDTQMSCRQASEKPGERQIFCGELADTLEEQARLLASARQCTAAFRRGELHGEIRCNENQIIRAFQNIVSNALDYNPPEGEIQIEWLIRAEKEKEYLAVVVQDTGPGFSAEDLKHAAERFYQGDKSRSSKTHYGIGLHTAQAFLQAQGGRLVIGNGEEGGGKVTLYIRIMDIL